MDNFLFKEGDKVRVVGNTSLRHLFPVGSIGYVTGVWAGTTCEVRVDGIDYTQTIHNNDLELVEREAPPTFRYVIQEGGHIYLAGYAPDSADRVWELGRELTKETKWV